MPVSTTLRQELRFTRVASGARIAWARSGQGPPLLRAGHGMTHVEYDCESALFRPWIERLGRGVTLYRYDERGCGLSGVDASLFELIGDMIIQGGSGAFQGATGSPGTAGVQAGFRQASASFTQ